MFTVDRGFKTFSRILSSVLSLLCTLSKTVNTLIIIVGGWLIEYINVSFPVLILKYLNIKKYSANFDENSKIYAKEVLVNEINGIINSDKFSHTFFGRQGIVGSLLVK